MSFPNLFINSIVNFVTQVKKGTGASVRVFVANAVIKLLRFLPKEDFDANLPGLIASMS